LFKLNKKGKSFPLHNQLFSPIIPTIKDTYPKYNPIEVMELSKGRPPLK
jgi:hypothetical protein